MDDQEPHSEPARSIQPLSPADEFWPDFVPNGTIVHMHGLSAACNVKCCVVATLKGLIETADE